MKGFLFLLLFYSVCCFPQNTGFSQDSLIQRIYSLQCQNDDFYKNGLFASERYVNNRRIKEDNNIFFTALITYTLQSLHRDVSKQNQTIADSIIARAKCNYIYYRNRKNDITYNFWQTHPDMPLPNNTFFQRFESSKLPDDFDDTSIILLTQEKNDSIDTALKQKMTNYTNSVSRPIHSTLKQYRDYNAYLTWFGEKMKQDIDICVMSNTMLYILQRDLPLNQFDSATIQLIEKMVVINDHIKNPDIVSPHYQNSSVILYHLSRLISSSDQEVLSNLKSPIINALYDRMHRANNRIEKVILLSSLYRLDEKPEVNIDFSDIENDFDDFTFFIANPFSGSSMFTKRIFDKNVFHIKYRCEAYYWTLILEYQVLLSS